LSVSTRLDTHYKYPAVKSITIGSTLTRELNESINSIITSRESRSFVATM